MPAFPERAPGKEFSLSLRHRVALLLELGTGYDSAIQATQRMQTSEGRFDCHLLQHFRMNTHPGESPPGGPRRRVSQRARIHLSSDLMRVCLKGNGLLRSTAHVET
jgi:hypothetical protein